MKRSRFSNVVNGFGLSLGLLGSTTMAGDSTAVYTMDNAASGNHVLVFQTTKSGQLSGPDSISTGGNGAGAGLSSQGSLALSHDGRWLFVCNAGSDEVSVLSTSPGGLQWVDKVPSGGRMPVSVAFRHNLLYVLNAGGTVGDKDNVTAFLFADGKLTAVPNSTRSLSADNTGPAQVAFTHGGDVLVVTERLTSLIDTFTLGDDGLAVSHQTFASSGSTPFGFAVGRSDRIFVSEASGVPNASSASSYNVSENGDLEVISPSVSTEQQAACWLTLTPDDHYAYTANAGSGTISGFSVAPDGALQLLQPTGISAVIGVGSHPVDMATSPDGRILFSLANGNGTLTALRVTENGSLGLLSAANGIPTSAAGLVAH